MIEQILQADRLLNVDQVEQARQAYGRVVELDPGNGIAVVGLARCALADGDDRKAYELASRALEIDPENDMARRMEARLSEILATRGEDVERPDVVATAVTHEIRPVTAGNGAPKDVVAADAPSGLASADATTTETNTTGSTSRSASNSPSPVKEPIVRKSLFDRLLGR